MKCLLDTHALIWWAMDHRSLSTTARDAIQDPSNDLVISVAAVWEIGIKAALGRLRFDTGEGLRFRVQELVDHFGIEILPITLDHVIEATSLPLHHRDPFDRMLIAQARVENLTLVTNDPQMRQYSVETHW